VDSLRRTLTRERAQRTEAMKQQAATAEILKVIAGSPSDVQPVFDAIVRTAGRLAVGSSVNVTRLVSDRLHLAVYTPVSASADQVLKNLFPIPVGEVGALANAVQKRSPFFVSDFETDPHVSASRKPSAPRSRCR
jgi:two-component system NtrC family sensor kinase